MISFPLVKGGIDCLFRNAAGLAFKPLCFIAPVMEEKKKKLWAILTTSPGLGKAPLSKVCAHLDPAQESLSLPGKVGVELRN